MGDRTPASHLAGVLGLPELLLADVERTERNGILVLYELGHLVATASIDLPQIVLGEGARMSSEIAIGRIEAVDLVTGLRAGDAHGVGSSAGWSTEWIGFRGTLGVLLFDEVASGTPPRCWLGAFPIGVIGNEAHLFRVRADRAYLLFCESEASGDLIERKALLKERYNLSFHLLRNVLFYHATPEGKRQKRPSGRALDEGVIRFLPRATERVKAFHKRAV